jgi:hydroxymethylbilane synthase
VADVFVSDKQQRFDDLPTGAIVATGSMRRRSQILHRRPDLKLVHIRGNVETRLRKLHDEGLDGIVLAQAGLERLGLADVITEVLEITWMLPAVGQGALGLECRADDSVTRGAVRPLTDPDTWHSVMAERAVLRALGGGCLLPIAAHAITRDGRVHLRAAVLDADGTRCLAGERQGEASDKDAQTLGESLADELLARGARELLGLQKPKSD